MAAKDPYNAFMSSTLEELAAPHKPVEPPPKPSQMFIGSVGGNVIFFGDVPPGVLELVIGRSRPTPQQP